MKTLTVYLLILLFCSAYVLGQRPKLTGFNNYTKWVDKHKDNKVGAKELLNLDEFILNDKGTFSFLVFQPQSTKFFIPKEEKQKRQKFEIYAKDNDLGIEWKVFQSYCDAGIINFFQLLPISGNITLICKYSNYGDEPTLTYQYNSQYKGADQHLNYYLSKDQIQTFSELNENKIKAFEGLKSVNLIVVQNYDWIRNFELPFEKTAKRLLEFTGMELADDTDSSFDLQIIVNVSGTSEPGTARMKYPGGSSYQTVSVRHHIGLNGTIIFKATSKVYYANDFNWKKKIYPLEYVAKGGLWSQNVNQLSSGYRNMFYQESFLKGFGEMLINAFGLNPVDFYLYAATDTIDAISYYALRLLGEHQDTTALNPLIDVYQNDSSIWKRRGAIYALGKMQDPRAFDILIQALSNEDYKIRNNAGETLFNALIEIEYPHAYDILIDALSEKYSTIRIYAINALDSLNDKRAVEPLILALDDKNYAVVKTVVFTLGNFGDNRSVDPLISLIEKAENNSGWKAREQKIVINAIIEVLGDLGNPSAIGYIIPLMKKSDSVKMHILP
jgi:HEAT repeat protein